ncbi:MAG: ribonuclease H [Candidatus Kapabacteria bacterium]|nr:ribonuclease H [Candidatus Kapabacteria bacterium]
MAAAKKWYVVWHGHNPGVYDSWDAAGKQVQGVPGAKYKSFPSKAEAEAAFVDGAALHISSASGGTSKRPKAGPRALPAAVRLPSIAVDAACDMTTGVMEYRGVDLATGAEIFRMGPFQDSSNNLGEFLAIVHALGWCKQQGSVVPIYSDSRTALSWVRRKFAKTTVVRTPGNAVVFDLIARAEDWVKKNAYANPVLKWNTEDWGENPADFGRK